MVVVASRQSGSFDETGEVHGGFGYMCFLGGLMFLGRKRLVRVDLG